MTANEVESELNRLGYDVDGVVTINPRGDAYAVGLLADEIDEDEVSSYRIIDDPSLSDES